MDILVVGGTGVLGRPTVHRLVRSGAQVTAAARRDTAAAVVRQAGATPIELDVFDRDATRAAVAGNDVVINIATKIPAPPAAVMQRAWRDNDRLRRDASRVLAEAAAATGAMFIQESFAPTYADNGARWITEEHPLEPVAQTQTVAAAEASAHLVTAAGGTGIVLRFGLFYGPDEAAARQWLDAAAKGRLALPGPPDRYSSMIHIDDAAAAIVAALGAPAGVYNVVEDEPLTRAEHARALADALGLRALKPLPALLGRLPVLRALSRSHRISNDKLRQATGWTPSVASVREGWKMVIDEIAR